MRPKGVGQMEGHWRMRRKEREWPKMLTLEVSKGSLRF